MTAISDLINEIFASILVYRMKDVNEGVRALCAKRLKQCIMADPDRLLKDEYMKHIGWNLSDHSTSVRAEAVETLSQVIQVSHLHYYYHFSHYFKSIIGNSFQIQLEYWGCLLNDLLDV